MARSEKDRALLFLAQASVTEDVRTDAFICAPSMGAHLRVQVPPQAGHSE